MITRVFKRVLKRLLSVGHTYRSLEAALSWVFVRVFIRGYFGVGLPSAVCSVFDGGLKRVLIWLVLDSPITIAECRVRTYPHSTGAPVYSRVSRSALATLIERLGTTNQLKTNKN